MVFEFSQIPLLSCPLFFGGIMPKQEAQGAYKHIHVPRHKAIETIIVVLHLYSIWNMVPCRVEYRNERLALGKIRGKGSQKPVGSFCCRYESVYYFSCTRQQHFQCRNCVVVSRKKTMSPGVNNEAYTKS